MATVLITGGTGLIGTALANALVEKDYQVVILTRNANHKSNDENISYANWNIRNQTIDKEAIEKADYIIHLAGANVAEKRWTKKRKNEIAESRVLSGQLLVKALKEISNKVKAVISASAIGYYGNDRTISNQQPFVETDSSANDFLGTTVQQWEAAIQPVTALGKRLVIFRTGIVLSNHGGAYKEFKKPLQFGAATVLGNGQQVISWIHINDVTRLYIEALENESWKGVYNAVAPNPVTNQQLIKAIAKERRKFFITIKVPSFILKIVLGEMSIEVLKSATVSSGKVQKEGFQFLFSTIREAIENLK